MRVAYKEKDVKREDPYLTHYEKYSDTLEHKPRDYWSSGSKSAVKWVTITTSHTRI